MLLVIGDERGLDVALDQFGRAVALLGDPVERVTSGVAVVGAWGHPPTISADNGRIVEGSAVFPVDGSDMLEQAARARGDFASIAVDLDGIVLSSGQAGGYRPIFVSCQVGRLIASTSFDAVCRLVGGGDLCPDMVAASVANPTMFSVARSNATSTLFARVQRVPMYEVWRIGSDSRIRARPTYRPVASSDLKGTEADLAVQLRDAFSAAVQGSMHGHQKVGVQVSGGVDSSSLLAVSHRLAQRGDQGATVEAFAWDYATYYGDDRPYLRSLSRHLGVEPLRTSPQDAGPSVLTTFVADGAPFCGPGGALFAATSRHIRRRGVTVLLSGVGGDEVVDGNPDLFADLALAGHPLRAIEKAVQLRGPCMGGPSWRVRCYVAHPLLRALVPARLRRTRREKGLLERYSWAGPRLLRWLRQAAAATPPPKPRLDWTAAERFDAMAHSPYLLQFCLGRAQEEAIVGCIRRDPFFDEGLLRALAAIPPLALLSQNYRRGLFRESMRGMLPEDVRLRDTKAMMEPALGEMVAAAGGFRALEPLANVEMLGDLGIAEPRRFRRAFDDLARNPDRGPWLLIWPALATEAFLRQQERR